MLLPGFVCRCGHGHCRYTDGSEYEGEWLRDMRHGSGRMTLTDGTVYDGQWREDKLHGAGAPWDWVSRWHTECWVGLCTLGASSQPDQDKHWTNFCQATSQATIPG